MKWRRLEAGVYIGAGQRSAWAVSRHDGAWRLVGFADAALWYAQTKTLRAAQQQAEEWETGR